MSQPETTLDDITKELHVARAIARALAKAATLHGDDHPTILEHIRRWEGIEVAYNQLPDWLATAARHTYDVDVFYLADNDLFGSDSWTWCQVIDGDPRDYAGHLPHCDSEDDARAKAYAWLAALYAKRAERATTPLAADGQTSDQSR